MDKYINKEEKLMHVIEERNSYKDVQRCILLFEDGSQKLFSANGFDKKLTVDLHFQQKRSLNFMEMVLLCYNDSSDIPSLSALCGYQSVKTFTRHFKKNFKTTPKQWLLEMKKERLVTMLRETNYPLREIAEKLNFSGVSHLCAFCLQKTGKRPEEIRKSARKR